MGIGGMAKNFRQCDAQCKGITNSGIEALPTRRTVDVCGITGQDYRAGMQGLGDSSVNVKPPHPAWTVNM